MKLTSSLMTRRSRWYQVGLNMSQAFLAAFLDVTELIRLGDDVRLIRKAMHRSISYDTYFSVALSAMNLAFRCPPPSNCPWHVDLDFMWNLLLVHNVVIQ